MEPEFTQHHKPLLDVYRATGQSSVTRKASQIGVTERNIAVTMGHCILGHTVMYVLPTIEKRNLFVKNRVDRQISASPLYRELAESTTEDALRATRADAVSFKALGDGGALFIGSNSKTAGLETPADVLIIDEYDYCDPDVLMLMRDRTKHSKVRHLHVIGNPTISGYGVDEEWERSDQRHWMVTCESCGEKQELTWWDNVVRRITDADFELRGTGENITRTFMLDRDLSTFEDAVKCRACAATIDRYGDGEWVAKFPTRRIAGHTLSQITCGLTPIGEMIDQFARAIADQSRMQHFRNNALGEAFDAEGARLSEPILARCTGAFPRQDHGRGCYMGMDVGNENHVVILDADLRVICAEVIPGPNPFAHAGEFVDRYGCTLVMVDIAPERASAHEFANTEFATADVMLCEMSLRDQSQEYRIDADERVVKIERTQFLDMSHAALLRSEITLPADIASVPDFMAHMGALTRVIDRTAKLPRYVWAGTKPDHYRFALGYAYLAAVMDRENGTPFIGQVNLGARTTKTDNGNGVSAPPDFEQRLQRLLAGTSGDDD